MPVYSMTGYASWQSEATPASSPFSEQASTLSNNLWRLGLELRSVNSRFLDIHFKLPEELHGLEATLRENIQRHVRRGKLELRATLLYQRATGQDTFNMPSVTTLQRLAAVQDHIRTWLPEAQLLGVADILNLSTPTHRPVLDTDWLHQTVTAGMAELLAAFKQSRVQEGEKLAQAIQERVSQLRMLAQQTAPLIPQLVQQQQERFLQRWQQALASTPGIEATVPTQVAQERALAEAAAFALRIDVAEEITRLQTHLDAVDALLDKGGELGKRLDFMIQELHREANTLGSKSAAINTSNIAIDMKVLIEQIREQVQNLE